MAASYATWMQKHLSVISMTVQLTLAAALQRLITRCQNWHMRFNSLQKRYWGVAAITRLFELHISSNVYMHQSAPEIEALHNLFLALSSFVQLAAPLGFGLQANEQQCQVGMTPSSLKPAAKADTLAYLQKLPTS